jgi:hypothetical protein
MVLHEAANDGGLQGRFGEAAGETGADAVEVAVEEVA